MDHTIVYHTAHDMHKLKTEFTETEIESFELKK